MDTCSRFKSKHLLLLLWIRLLINLAIHHVILASNCLQISARNYCQCWLHRFYKPPNLCWSTINDSAVTSAAIILSTLHDFPYENSDGVVLESEATSHIACSLKYFISHKPVLRFFVTLPGRFIFPIHSIHRHCTVVSWSVLQNVFYIPQFHVNHISSSALSNSLSSLLLWILTTFCRISISKDKFVILTSMSNIIKAMLHPTKYLVLTTCWINF